MWTGMRWTIGLILGALFAPGAARAGVNLSASLGNWSIGDCDTPHAGQFELGDSLSENCSQSSGDESHSASLQEASSIVNGSNSVDSFSFSATLTVQATSGDSASAYVDLRCTFEVATPTPFILNLQQIAHSGPIEGYVKLSVDQNGCECTGPDCTVLGCDSGSGNLVLQGVLQPGITTIIAEVAARVSAGQQTESGTAQLNFEISFNRASATYFWSNPSGGDYSKDTNWNPRGVPTHDAQVSDIAIFDPGLYGVNVAGAKAGRFVIRRADVALIGNAEVFGTTASPASLEVEGNASLQLNGGSSLRAVHGAVGVGPPASSADVSAILLDGAATLLAFSGNLSVGPDMPGQIAVDGGILLAADVQFGGAGWGELEVNGVNARATLVDVAVGGNPGMGILEVLNGGAVTASNIRIGENQVRNTQTNLTNRVDVKGAGSGGNPARLNVGGNLLVGNGGFGQLFVSDGAIAEVGGYLGAGVDNVGDVTVESQDLTHPATLKVAHELQIGYDNASHFDIRSGGRVEAGSARINFGGHVGGGMLKIDGKGQSNAAQMKISQELGVGGDPQVIPVFVKNGGILTARSAIIGNDVLLTDEAVVKIGTFGGGDTAPAEFNIVDPNSGQLTGGGKTIVGDTGPGRLDVAGGAIARFTGTLMIGEQAEGAVSVDNLDSPAGLRSTAILSDYTIVGYGAVGDLTISNGGLLTSNTDIEISRTSAGEIRVFNGQGVAGDRAELRMPNNTLEVGSGGPGTLTVQGNGLVRCARLLVGRGLLSDGEVLVDTGGEIDCLADMIVGFGEGSGSVTVGPAGTLVVDSVLTIGGTSEGLIALTDATSRVSAGILSGASTFVKNHGSIVGVGTLATTHLIVEPGGFVSPGLSPGTLTIDGDYEQQQGATLVIEAAGTAPGQFDVLNIAGNAKLFGSVELKFINGFVPEKGVAFDFLRISGAVEGAFEDSTIEVPADTIAGTPALIAQVRWELTADGIARLTVTDVTEADATAPDAPPTVPGCGSGLCGVGAVPMLPLVLVALSGMRRVLDRQKRRG